MTVLVIKLCGKCEYQYNDSWEYSEIYCKKGGNVKLASDVSINITVSAGRNLSAGIAVCMVII